MIYINKNSLNKIVLTLTESSRISNPNYLFHFVNEYGNDTTGFTFTTPDLTTSTNRYNLFNLTEATTGSTSGGNDIPLSLTSGQYIYRVYEASASTLQISATTGQILETGRMVVATTNNNSTEIINNIYI